MSTAYQRIPVLTTYRNQHTVFYHTRMEKYHLQAAWPFTLPRSTGIFSMHITRPDFSRVGINHSEPPENTQNLTKLEPEDIYNFCKAVATGSLSNQKDIDFFAENAQAIVKGLSQHTGPQWSEKDLTLTFTAKNGAKLTFSQQIGWSWRHGQPGVRVSNNVDPPVIFPDTKFADIVGQLNRIISENKPDRDDVRHFYPTIPTTDPAT